MVGGVPVIEAIDSPAEECRLSAPCSFGDLWAPHGEEGYPTNQSAIASEVETVVEGTTHLTRDFDLTVETLTEGRTAG
jgi:hypothetical protein